MPVPEHILEKIIVKKKRAKICALKFKRILGLIELILFLDFSVQGSAL